MLKVFIGYDDRQVLSFTTLVQSIYETASRPVAVSPLILETLPITRRGLTPFTFSRFLVPWLCDFTGTAIFMDADMLLVSDICELQENIQDDIAVSVVRSLEQYEQTSFMVFNCEHPENKVLTPDFVQETETQLHGLEWVKPEAVGSLDPKWNQLVGYQAIDSKRGNLHYTMGIPAFAETSSSEGMAEWRSIAQRATSATSWREIMGSSVHAINIEGVKFPRYVWDFEKNQPKPEHLNLVKTLLTKAKEKK
jgi:hypothetical protein